MNAKFKTKPYKHQLDAMAAARGKEAFAYFCEMGTGKSACVINEIASLGGEGKCDAAIIFAPKGVHTNWVVNELPKHWPDWIKYESVDWRSGAGKQRMQKIEQILKPKPGVIRILVMNWDSIVYESGYDFAVKFCLTTQKLMIVGDESQRIKNPQAERTKALERLRKYSSWRRIMSGSPVLNSPFDMYAQMRFLDPYILRTDSYFAFKTEYAELLQPGNRLLEAIVKNKFKMSAERRDLCVRAFNEIEEHFVKNGRPELNEALEAMRSEFDDKDWEGVVEKSRSIRGMFGAGQSSSKTRCLVLMNRIDMECMEVRGKAQRMLNSPKRLPQIVAKGKDGAPKYRNLDKLKRLVDPYSFRAYKKDCLDLPDKVYKRLWYEMSPKQAIAYKKMQDEARIILENDLETPVNKLAVLMKLAQICSGFVMEPVTKRVVQIEPGKSTPKLDMLKERLEDSAVEAGNSIIVWARFVEELEQIEELCGNMGLSCGVYRGSTSDEDRKRITAEFESGELQVFIGQQQAGGTGITLVRAKHVIYYSNSFSLEHRVQSEDRAHRIGQVNKVLYEDLLGEKTMEIKVLKALESKQNVADVIGGKNASSFLEHSEEEEFV